MRTKLHHKHERLSEFLVISRVIIFCFHVFVQVGFLTGFELQTSSARNREPSTHKGASKQTVSLRLTHGFQLGLEIAVTSGFQRRSSPTGFFSPAEDALKTPDGVIKGAFTNTAECRVLDLSPRSSRNRKGGQRYWRNHRIAW